MTSWLSREKQRGIKLQMSIALPNGFPSVEQQMTKIFLLACSYKETIYLVLMGIQSEKLRSSRFKWQVKWKWGVYIMCKDYRFPPFFAMIFVSPVFATTYTLTWDPYLSITNLWQVIRAVDFNVLWISCHTQASPELGHQPIVMWRYLSVLEPSRRNLNQEFQWNHRWTTRVHAPVLARLVWTLRRTESSWFSTVSWALSLHGKWFPVQI